MNAGTIVFLIETFGLISCTTIFGVFYGTAFSLYCLCAQPLYLKLYNPEKRRQAMFSLGYTSFLFFCATGFFILNVWVIPLVYINHGGVPGGPFGYGKSFNSVLNPYQAAGGILDFIIKVSTMIIQIRRLWIIWSATQYAAMITLLPMLLLFAHIALNIPASIVDTVVSVDIPDGSLIAMVTAAYIVPASFTSLVTGSIAAHLLLARRRLAKILGTSDTASPYLSIVAVLVESYVFESAWSLAAAITFAVGNPSYILFLENDSIVKIITYFLIVYRVETGRGWTKQTEKRLTSLQWNLETQDTTDETTSLRSRVPATTAIQV